jgi:hypothetical protein
MVVKNFKQSHNLEFLISLTTGELQNLVENKYAGVAFMELGQHRTKSHLFLESHQH